MASHIIPFDCFSGAEKIDTIVQDINIVIPEGKSASEFSSDPTLRLELFQKLDCLELIDEGSPADVDAVAVMEWSSLFIPIVGLMFHLEYPESPLIEYRSDCEDVQSSFYQAVQVTLKKCEEYRLCGVVFVPFLSIANMLAINKLDRTCAKSEDHDIVSESAFSLAEYLERLRAYVSASAGSSQQVRSFKRLNRLNHWAMSYSKAYYEPVSAGPTDLHTDLRALNRSRRADAEMPDLMRQFRNTLRYPEAVLVIGGFSDRPAS